jgi:hypothetical protein
MAKTYPVGALKFFIEDDPDLSFAERSFVEAASQTFDVGAPLKLTTSGGPGALAEWVSNADAQIYAWALTKGQNSTSVPAYVISNNDQAITPAPTMLKGLLANHNVVIEGNLLAASAADYVLLAADWGAQKDLIKKTALYKAGGATHDGWYIQNTASAATVQLFSFGSMFSSTTTNDWGAIPSDTDAIVRVKVIPGKSVWY